MVLFPSLTSYYDSNSLSLIAHGSSATFMRSGLTLLLPALIPSWRFFDYIAPSPRIQYLLLDAQGQPVTEWQAFRPRPMRVSTLQMLGRLFWNPQWNETLFMVSCAERIMEHHTPHSEDQILARIAADWRSGHLLDGDAVAVQFRLVFVHRVGGTLEQQVRFTSKTLTLTRATS